MHINEVTTLKNITFTASMQRLIMSVSIAIVFQAKHFYSSTIRVVLIQYQEAHLLTKKINSCSRKGYWRDVFYSIWSGLPCFVLLFTWLHVFDYHNFWKTEKWQSENSQFTIKCCFSHRNVLQNCVNSLSKIVYLFIYFFFLKLTFCTFRTLQFGSNFASMYSKYYQIMYGETVDFQCQHLQR